MLVFYPIRKIGNGFAYDTAYEFMQDCAERIVGRPQITTDALRHYLTAVEDAFGAEVDYAQAHKLFGARLPTNPGIAP